MDVPERWPSPSSRNSLVHSQRPYSFLHAPIAFNLHFTFSLPFTNLRIVTMFSTHCEGGNVDSCWWNAECVTIHVEKLRRFSRAVTSFLWLLEECSYLLRSLLRAPEDFNEEYHSSQRSRWVSARRGVRFVGEQPVQSTSLVVYSEERDSDNPWRQSLRNSNDVLVAKTFVRETRTLS